MVNFKSLVAKVRSLLFTSLLAASLIFVSNAAVAKPLKLTLEDAVMLALRYNPNIQSNRLDRIVEKFNLRVAIHEFEPQPQLVGEALFQRLVSDGVNTRSSFTRIEPGVKLKLPYGTQLSASLPNTWNGDQYSPQARFSISQPLLRGFGRAVNERQLNDAFDNEEINKLRLRQTVSDEITNVILAYHRVIVDNNTIETAEQSLRSAQKTVAVNNALIKAGRIAETVNIEAKAQVQSLKLALNQVTNAKQQDTRLLLTAIGLDPETELKLPSDVAINVSPPTFNETYNFALQHNFNYLSALTEKRKNQRGLIVAKDNARVALNVEASTSFGNSGGFAQNAPFDSLFNGRNQDEQLRLSLDVPLDQVALKRDISSSKVNLKKDDINIAKQKRELTSRIKNFIQQIASSKQQVALGEQAVKLKQESYQLQLKKQALGLATSIDVTNSQNALISAKVQLITDKITYLDTIASLNADIGKTLQQWHVAIRS